MEYIGVLCIVVVVIVGVAFCLRLKKPTVATVKTEENHATPVIKNNEELIKNDSINDIAIQVESFPMEAFDYDENKLVEIKDSKILACINNLIPSLAQTGNNLNNAAKAIQIKNIGTLYRAIIPKDVKLANSKAMDGALRGIYHGQNGIKGHANLVAADTQTGNTVAANTTAAAMNVASMVVGQYYMTQINAELNVISDGISQIQNFQDNEYRSRVFSLLTHVKKIADFQTEILENNELRISKIAQLDSLEEECTQLLGQANLTLAGFTKKTKLDYDSYEKAVVNADNWFMYQKGLLDMLYKISDLRYALHLGMVSREQCNAILPTYAKQVNDTQNKLTAWHTDGIEKFKIDIDEVRRKRTGFDGALHFLPGLFNNDFNYRSIENSTLNMISEQTSGENKLFIDTTELYSNDVQLIAMEGKIYYLPETSNQ